MPQSKRYGQPIGRHQYTATLDGRKITVKDSEGNQVEVTFAGTTDNGTLYAYTAEGFIGGWTCRAKRPRPRWEELAASINAHRLYRDMDDLPRVLISGGV